MLEQPALPGLFPKVNKNAALRNNMESIWLLLLFQGMLTRSLR